MNQSKLIKSVLSSNQQKNLLGRSILREIISITDYFCKELVAYSTFS